MGVRFNFFLFEIGSYVVRHNDNKILQVVELQIIKGKRWYKCTHNGFNFYVPECKLMGINIQMLQQYPLHIRVGDHETFD